MAVLFSFVCCAVLTPLVIRFAPGASSPVKEELVPVQKEKEGTCALGSAALFLSYSLAALISEDRLCLSLLAVCAPFFLIGIADDILKWRKSSSDGFKSLTKLCLQLVAAGFAAFMLRGSYHSLSDLIYYPAAILFIAATVNAMNISDGLDGLAAKLCLPGLVLIAAASVQLRQSSLIMTSILAAWLIYNSCRASIFMGDGGSHFLGAFTVCSVLMSKNAAGALIPFALIYVELLSSLIQIISIRLFNRKVFLIAPLHHDLERRGIREEKITDTFFSVSVFLSLISAILVFEVI